MLKFGTLALVALMTAAIALPAHAEAGSAPVSAAPAPNKADSVKAHAPATAEAATEAPQATPSGTAGGAPAERSRGINIKEYNDRLGGTLSRGEVYTRFKALDTDKNGRLSEDELKADKPVNTDKVEAAKPTEEQPR